MSDKKTIIEKNSLLKDVWDESSRLQPLMLTLIDDFETLSQQTIFLGHYLNHLVVKNSSRNLILLLFGTNEQHFHRFTQIKNENAKIQIFNEYDNRFNLSDCNALESQIISLASKNTSNVLIINSVNPFFLIFDDGDNDSRKFYQFLQKLRIHYQQILLIYHSMFDPSIDDINEANIVYISNVIIDFRLKNTKKKFSERCSLIGDDLLTNKTIHCRVITRKKHPRTHLQVDEKHEHIQFDNNNSNVLKFINQYDLLKDKKISDHIDYKQLPQSSFRLTLSKQEEEARDNVILPYTKKQNTTNNSTESNIIYTFDKFDDFDDEDPDDDLDF